MSMCLGAGLRAERSVSGFAVISQRLVINAAEEGSPGGSSWCRVSNLRRRRMTLALRRIEEMSWRTVFGQRCLGSVPLLGAVDFLRGNMFVASVKALPNIA